MAAAVLENENTLGTKVEPHSIVGSRHTDVLQSEAWCDSWLALIPAFAKFAHERAYDRDFEGDISKPVTSSSKIPRILDYQQFLYSQSTQIQRSRFSETIREILSPEV